MLVSNHKKVLLRASSLWAAYGGLVLLLLDYLAKWLQGDESAGVIQQPWRDLLLGALLIAIPYLRVQRQESLQPPAIHPLEE
jgi:hypothetical protein